MAKEEIFIIQDAEALGERIAEILVSGPLYKAFRYLGTDCHFVNQHSFNKARYGTLPQIRMYCENKKCEALTWWEPETADVYFGSSYIKDCVYKCRNCGVRNQHYLLIWHEHDGGNTFIKAGQYPPLTIEPSPELARVLDKTDAALYKKGLIDFNFGHGIGAVGYMRRIVENKINSLLDLIAETARNAQLDEHLPQIEEVKKSHRVEDKIDLAVKILPSHLKPGGHNPLDKLYGPLSIGLHGESDDQCLTVFSEARFALEYLFKNLTEANEDALKYVKWISAPKLEEKR